MDNLPYKFYFKDRDSRFVAVSRLAPTCTARDPAEMAGLTDQDLLSSEHAEAALGMNAK